MVNMKTAKCSTCGSTILKLTGRASGLCHDECKNCRDNRAEAEYLDHQQSLMESGGVDDSTYRRDMIAAGRGHLVQP